MRKSISLSLCAGLILIIGCSQDAPKDANPQTTNKAAAVDGAKFLLDAEPEDAADVIAVHESAQDDEEVVIVGRIGGDVNPWVDGRAAFSIVDGSLRACSDIPGDSCPKPWDYCCETHKLKGAMALVKIVDEQGETVKADPRELLNVKELSTVVVKGKAKRDEAGNLSVLADGVYVKSK